MAETQTRADAARSARISAWMHEQARRGHVAVDASAAAGAPVDMDALIRAAIDRPRPEAPHGSS